MNEYFYILTITANYGRNPTSQITIRGIEQFTDGRSKGEIFEVLMERAMKAWARQFSSSITLTDGFTILFYSLQEN